MPTENEILLDRIKIIRNGGIEQAFLEIANEDNLLNDNDKKRLSYLQSLNQNRAETTDGIILAENIKFDKLELRIDEMSQ